MKSKDAKLHRKIRQNWIKNLKKLNSLHQNAPVTSKSLIYQNQIHQKTQKSKMFSLKRHQPLQSQKTPNQTQNSMSEKSLKDTSNPTSKRKMISNFSKNTKSSRSITLQNPKTENFESLISEKN